MSYPDINRQPSEEERREAFEYMKLNDGTMLAFIRTLRDEGLDPRLVQFTEGESHD